MGHDRTGKQVRHGAFGVLAKSKYQDLRSDGWMRW